MTDEVNEVFPPANPQEEFRQQCQRLNENKEFAALPSITYAMYPEDVHFRDDLSDERFFNERFIEPRTEGNGAFVARIFTAVFNFSLLSVLVFAPLLGEYEKPTDPLGALIFVCGPFGLMAWFFLWFATGGNTGGGGIRFNRQAQLVHITLSDRVVSLPWRDVRPYLEMGTVSGLDLFFPIPYQQLANWEPIRFKRAFQGHPLEVPGNFDAHDSALHENLILRLEFIRCYMEHGLEAIQPSPQAIANGELRVPSGFVQVQRTLAQKLTSPVAWAYYLSAGPWVDAYIKKKADAYVWPEEIERLCAPGADLTGYDTPRSNPTASCSTAGAACTPASNSSMPAGAKFMFLNFLLFDVSPLIRSLPHETCCIGWSCTRLPDSWRWYCDVRRQ